MSSQGHDDVTSQRSIETEVLARLPLAEGVLTLWSYLADAEFLRGVFDRHRGRSFEHVLSFPVFVQLIADALMCHHGSGRQSFKTARDTGQLSTQLRAVYGKLSRVPQALALGLFAEMTARLRLLLPVQAPLKQLPNSLATWTVVIVDGKKIKKVAKRLQLLRDLPGKVYGGKLLAAYLPREGLVGALAADLDGEANDIRLMPQLMPLARAAIPGPRLWVADRQFSDLDQPERFGAQGDEWVIRFSQKMGFEADPAVSAQERRDALGRRVLDEWGWIGSVRESRRRYVRHITLERPGEEAVILITSLLDANAVPASDLLELYLARWQIEQVFQQITDVFGLRQLIGSSPEATVFQGVFCLALYNMMQVVRTYIAAGQQEPVAVADLSMEQIYKDVKKELIALDRMLDPEEQVRCRPQARSVAEVQERLQQLFHRRWSWDWRKARNAKPRPYRPKVKQSGAHTSVARVLRAYREQKRRAAQPPPKG